MKVRQRHYRDRSPDVAAGRDAADLRHQQIDPPPAHMQVPDRIGFRILRDQLGDRSLQQIAAGPLAVRPEHCAAGPRLCVRPQINVG